jgi:hypothetical protein
MPVAWLGRRKTVGKEIAHAFPTFNGLNVPSEGDEIAPVAFLAEEGDGGLDITFLERLAESAQQAFGFRVRCGVQHGDTETEER